MFVQGTYVPLVLTPSSGHSVFPSWVRAGTRKAVGFARRMSWQPTTRGHLKSFNAIEHPKVHTTQKCLTDTGRP